MNMLGHPKLPKPCHTQDTSLLRQAYMTYGLLKWVMSSSISLYFEPDQSAFCIQSDNRANKACCKTRPVHNNHYWYLGS